MNKEMGMTAKTEAEALALEAARGAQYRAEIRAEGFRAGYAAALDAAAREINMRELANMPAENAEAAAYCHGCRDAADSIRSLPIPEDIR